MESQKLKVGNGILLVFLFSWSAAASDAGEAPEPPANRAPGSEVPGPPHDLTELAKKSQNPVSNLISVPLQNNFNFGMGPDYGTGFNLNVQPVLPLALNRDWNLIARPIIPVYDIPIGEGRYKGCLGDITLETFLTPSKNRKFIWGVGPMAIFPSATDPLLGSGKWCLGPSVVGVFMEGPWVAGALITQAWSIGGKSARPDIAPFGIQPFINYNFGKGWAVGTSPQITADWEQNRRESWTVPLGGSISRTFVLCKQPMSLALASYYNVDKPTGVADWQARVALTLMFPE